VTADELTLAITNLTKAISKGTLRAKAADGKEHWYRSVDQMIKARQLLENDLSKLTKPTRKRRALNIHVVGVR